MTDSSTPPPNGRPLTSSRVPPTQRRAWRQFKRRAFATIGIALVFAGLVTIGSGLRSLMRPGGELADLGAGPGAIVVAILCLLLGFHPRSPLRLEEQDD